MKNIFFEEIKQNDVNTKLLFKTKKKKFED